MNPVYAIAALVFMMIIYLLMSSYNPDKKNLSLIFQGVIFQISRQLQVFLQKAQKEQHSNWRPSAICISDASFKRFDAFYLLKWISQRYGFGTYIYFMRDYLSKQSNKESKHSKERLIKMAETSHSNVYIDTMVSPSFTSAIAQAIQLPGISGKENNLLILEYARHNDKNLEEIIDNFKLIRAIDYDVAILSSTEKGFGLRKEIHIYLTHNDYDNANMMILLSYIILGHKDWKGGLIKIFAVFTEDQLETEQQRLYNLIDTGQLAISRNNIVLVPKKPSEDLRTTVNHHSSDADLLVLGFSSEKIKGLGVDAFRGFDNVGNILFVNDTGDVLIKMHV
jgi:hypothetical protein